MKKSIVIFLGLFYSIASFAQYDAGDYVNADTFKLNNTEVYLKHLYLGNEENMGKVPKNFVDSIGWVSPDSIQDLKLEFDNDTLRISLRTVLQDKESFVKMSVSTVNHLQYKINDLRISNDTLYLEQGDTVLIANINNVWVQDSSEVKAQLRDWLYSVARTISSADKTAWNNSFFAVTSPFYIPGSTQGIEYYFRNRANQTVGTITLVPANMLYPGLMTSAQYQLVKDWENSVAYNIDAADTARWGVKYWSLEPDSINLLPLDTVGNSVFRLNLKQTGARFQSEGPQLHLDYNDSTYSAVITDSAGVLNLVPSGGIVATSGHINLEGGLYQRGKHYMIEPFLYGNPGDAGTVPVSQGPNLPPVWGPAGSGSGSMVYPSSPGLVKFNGTTWSTSITDNSNNWNAAYTYRLTTASAPLSLNSNAISFSFAKLVNENTMNLNDTILFYDISAGGFRKSRIANLADVLPFAAKMAISTYDFNNNQIVDNSEKLGNVAASSYVTLTGAQALTNKSYNGVTLISNGDGTKVLTNAGTYITPPSGGATNLSYTQTSTTVTIASDTGTDAEVPSATTTYAGVMSAADKVKLDKFRDPTPQSITTSASCATYCNFYTSASSSKTITFSNLLDGLTGNIEVSYSGAAVLTFAASGYTIVIAPVIHNTGDSVISQSSGRSVYSYWVRGTYIYINGTQLYR